MIRLFLLVVSACSVCAIPSISSWLKEYEITNKLAITNSLLPFIVLAVVCIAFYRIIVILEEIRDKEK
jgi:hypothetical protein